MRKPRGGLPNFASAIGDPGSRSNCANASSNRFSACRVLRSAKAVSALGWRWCAPSPNGTREVWNVSRLKAAAPVLCCACRALLQIRLQIHPNGGYPMSAGKFTVHPAAVTVHKEPERNRNIANLHMIQRRPSGDFIKPPSGGFFFAPDQARAMSIYRPVLKFVNVRVCTLRIACGIASGATMVFIAAASRKMDLFSATSFLTNFSDAALGFA